MMTQRLNIVWTNIWQRWDWIIGTEWLLANPVKIPNMQDLLSRCLRTESYSAAVFRESDRATMSDPFRELPPELKALIVQYLNRQSTANLRLASRSFGQLPQTYFRFLIKHEMPWLWEIVDDPSADTKYDWYKLFSAIHSSENAGLLWDEMDQKYWDWFKEVTATAYDSFDEAASAYARAEIWVDECTRKMESGEWPAREEPGLRGLRNRKRIWNDIQKIFEFASEDNLLSDPK